MTVEMLKGKIHRATVVQAELDYVGSITVDEELLEAAGIMEYEKVQIVDVNNGSRFETYTICGKRGSGMICLNGAAARCASVKDKVIIMSYAYMTPEEAKELLLTNVLYFGCIMVKAGDADGMVAGAVNSSANVLRAALQILKTAPDTKLVSAFFLVVVPNCEMGEHGTFIFSDAGLNQFPDARELAAIAESSAKSFELLVEAEPIVAMLSHSTKGSAHHPEIDKVIEACRIVNEECPNLKCDGELQSDAAIVPEVAASKAPGSDVAGKANVLIFPDLDAGNIGYKLVQRLAKADAYGPITQGIAKPVNDLSRGCSADDIVGVVAITAVQAQALDQK